MINLKTWKDCITKFKSLYYINSFAIVKKVNNSKFLYENCVPSEELAKKLLIFQKLITCREAYIEGWKPNWENEYADKYCIIESPCSLEVVKYNRYPRTFCFPSKSLAEYFINNFREELKFIKEFL